MKKIKRSFLKKYNKLIIALIGLLGVFTSCEPEIDDHVVPLYGVEIAEYENLDSIMISSPYIQEELDLSQIDE